MKRHRFTVTFDIGMAERPAASCYASDGYEAIRILSAAMPHTFHYFRARVVSVQP